MSARPSVSQKPWPKQCEADETGSRAPLEYARLPRHAKVVEQWQVIEAKRAASAIEMIAIADANIAIGHITPRF